MKTPKCRRGDAEFFDPGDPGERLERDGKLERIHLPDERVLEPGPGSGRTQDPDSIGRQVGRAKKRQALDVVPMGVRNEEVKVERSYL